MDTTPSTGSDLKENQPLNIEKMIKLHVYPQSNGKFKIISVGMEQLGKPELLFHVEQGMWVASACRVMNDVARYMVESGDYIKTGMRLQIAPWTVVEFVRWPGAGKPVLELRNATMLHS